MNTDNLPAMLARMLNAKTEHEAAGLPAADLDGILGQAYDMGNPEEQAEVQAWTNRQGDAFFSAAFSAKTLAIAATHRLTTEGGGAAEQ